MFKRLTIICLLNLIIPLTVETFSHYQPQETSYIAFPVFNPDAPNNTIKSIGIFYPESREVVYHPIGYINDARDIFPTPYGQVLFVRDGYYLLDVQTGQQKRLT